LSNKKINTGISLMTFSLLLIGASLIMTISVKSEVNQVTIFEEGFEDWSDDGNLPSDMWDSNNGWLKSYFEGSVGANSGREWAYSWAAGDTLKTILINFGDNTELTFWYAMEKTGHPMTLRVYIDETTLIWSKENYANINYVQAIVNLSSYNGEHTISFVAGTSDQYGQLLDDVKITSYYDEEDDPTGDENDSPPAEDNGGLNPLPPVENKPPVADISNGEPYQGYTNGSIFFDGTLSDDSDGEIIKWLWDLGDGNTRTGETFEYSYANSGDYNVILEVFDDDGLTSTDSTIVIVLDGNDPPSKPIVRASLLLPTLGSNEYILKEGDVNISLTFKSDDPDNDSISYIIDWGDGSTQTLNNTQSGFILNVAHSWNSPSKYNVTFIAKDENDALSEETRIVVFAGLPVEIIRGDISGYLFSYVLGGDFSNFYFPEDEIETELGTDEKNQYLIDINGDAEWDYIYNNTIGLISYQSENENNFQDSNNSEDNEETPGFGLFLISVSFLFIILRKKMNKRI
jgi:hypothetical protein